jgi:hypothetical protein
MATATPGILINSISGKIGNVVFYLRQGCQCVRAHVIPRNPDTEAQRFVRRSFAEAVRSWQTMTREDKYTYIRRARYLNMSGYNLFISNYIKRVLQTIDRTSTQELKSKVSSQTWNPEHSIFYLHLVPGHSPGVPSVSDSIMHLSLVNSDPGQQKLQPG